MTLTEFGTDPDEFVKFHFLLTRNAPDYLPFYVQLKRKSKLPVNSINFEHNRKTWQQCVTLLSLGFNIGLAAKPKDSLVLIDVDDREKVKDVPVTLKDISRSRLGNHYYYVTNDPKTKINLGLDDLGEIRSSNWYVVTPGSFVPCKPEEIEEIPDEEKHLAGRCTLGNNEPAKQITYEDFPKVFKEAKAQQKETSDTEEVKKVLKVLKRSGQKNYKDNLSALWKLTIEDVTGLCDTKGKRISTPVELHGSTNGNNCSIHNGVLNCYRHGVCHNAFSFLSVAAGLMTCGEAGKPHGHIGACTHFGVDATDGKTVLAVWKFAKEKGLIPSDDPFPSRDAMLEFAKEKGIVSDGTNLTNLQYALVKICGKIEWRG